MDRAVAATLHTGGSIAALIPTSFEDVQRLARCIHASGFAPKDSTEAQVMGSILKGLELGVPPMQAVQGIAVINGRPAIWGDLMMALVTRSELCEDIEEFIEGEGESMVAVCRARRAGRVNPIERRFSVEDAKRARLWQTKDIVKRRRKDGTSYDAENDSPWYRFPKRMLQMRARALCLRDAFPDVLSGLASADEMQDESREMRDVTPPRRRNPLEDPPAEVIDDGGSAVITMERGEDGGHAASEQDDEDRQEDSAEEATGVSGDAFPGDHGPVGITVGGFQVPPPSTALAVSEFVTYIDALTKATTVEGIMGAKASARAAVEMLPQNDRELFNVAYGFRKGEINGTPTPGDPLAQLRAWAISEFRSAE